MMLHPSRASANGENPSVPGRQLEHRGTFVEKPGARTESTVSLLFGANPVDAGRPRRLRWLRGPTTWVFGTTCPEPSVHGSPLRDRNGQRNASRSLRQPVSESVDPLGGPVREGFSTRAAPTSAVATSSIRPSDLDAAWPSSFWGGLPVELLPLGDGGRQDAQHPGSCRGDDLPPADPPPKIVAARVLHVFPVFSCMIASPTQGHLVLLFKGQ
jgi:hypothetical protein